MATSTPWGQAQYQEKIANGISFFGTAGHGGYRVSAGKFDKVCKAKNMDCQYTSKVGGYVWFEEDCEWAFVAILFPEHFKADNIEIARNTIRKYWPNKFPKDELMIIAEK